MKFPKKATILRYSSLVRKVKKTSTDAHACMSADVRSLFYLAISQVASVSLVEHQA